MNLNNQIKSNESKYQIDRYVKKQIDILDFTPIPLKHWSKSKSWEIIKQKIGNADSKLIAWTMAMAATISLTVAAGLQLNFDSLFNNTPQKSNQSAQVLPKKNQTTLQYHSENEISTITKIQPKQNSSSPTFETNLTIPKTSPTSPICFLKKQLIFNENIANKRFNPFVTIGINSQNITPEIGIDFLIYSIKNNFKSKNVKLGLSTEFNQYKKENSSKTTASLFANLTYEITDIKNNKGWTVKSSVLLNPDSNYYQNTTVKLGLKRQFNKWLKVGPEIVFTNNWKTIYPSLTLTMGS